MDSLEKNIMVNQEDKMSCVYDRFDLEQEIMRCWNILEDLKILQENILNGGTVDENANINLGIMSLYEKKFEKLFEIFELLVHFKKIP